MPDEAVFEGSGQSCVDSDAEDCPDQGDAYFLKSPPELPPPLPSTVNITQPSKAVRDGFRESYLQRPLPDIPLDRPIIRSRQVSAASSVRSTTPSITPSLMSCVYDGSIDGDMVELGLARVVDLVPFKADDGCESEIDVDSHIQQLANSSFSDYDISPPSTSDSNSDRILSPRSYLPTTGSSFEFDLAQFSSPHPRQESRLSVVGVATNQTLPCGVFPNFSRPNRMPNPCLGGVAESYARQTLQLEESRWMSHTPSPNPEQYDMRRPRSPRDDLPDSRWSPAAGRVGESSQNGESSTDSTRMKRLSSSPNKISTARHILQVNTNSSGNQSDSDWKGIHGTREVAVVTPGFEFGLNEKQDGESGNWI